MSIKTRNMKEILFKMVIYYSMFLKIILQQMNLFRYYNNNYNMAYRRKTYTDSLVLLITTRCPVRLQKKDGIYKQATMC